MKKNILILFLIGIFGVGFVCRNDKEKDLKIINVKLVYFYEEKLKSEVVVIRRFLGEFFKYNLDVVFFLDMKIELGKNWFFIYDLKFNKINGKGLVVYGFGLEIGILGKLIFSNVKNFNCSFLGKYVIGGCYSGSFGKVYKLYGLDKINSNVFD